MHELHVRVTNGIPFDMDELHLMRYAILRIGCRLSTPVDARLIERECPQADTHWPQTDNPGTVYICHYMRKQYKHNTMHEVAS